MQKKYLLSKESLNDFIIAMILSLLNQYLLLPVILILPASMRQIILTLTYAYRDTGFKYGKTN